MRLIALLLGMTLLPGCAVLGMLGIGPKDLAPSLQYCHEVSYKRVGIDAEIRAKCRVPAG
jgi:hypothetical protein